MYVKFDVIFIVVGRWGPSTIVYAMLCSSSSSNTCFSSQLLCLNSIAYYRSCSRLLRKSLSLFSVACVFTNSGGH